MGEGGVSTLIALHCGSNIFNMAAKAVEIGCFRVVISERLAVLC